MPERKTYQPRLHFQAIAVKVRRYRRPQTSSNLRLYSLSIAQQLRQCNPPSEIISLIAMPQVLGSELDRLIRFLTLRNWLVAFVTLASNHTAFARVNKTAAITFKWIAAPTRFAVHVSAFVIHNHLAKESPLFKAREFSTITFPRAGVRLSSNPADASAVASLPTRSG
jgi:hypothetical protein